MSALAELQSNGAFRHACLQLLFRLTRSEARRFPELRPGGGWTEEAVWDMVGEFFAAKGKAVTAMLLAQAPDDEVMGKLLRTSVRHWLVDVARETDRGAMRRRIEKVLASSPETFEQVPSREPGAGWWRLLGSSEPSGEPFENLVVAAWRVTDVVVPRWTSETRRAPFADAASVRHVLVAVLGAARGSVDVATLTNVFARRFPMAVDPREQVLSEDPEPILVAAELQDPATVLEQQDAAVEVSLRAREVFGELSADERRLIPVMDRPIAEQMTALSRGRSETYRHTAALKERLRAMLGGETERDTVMLAVQNLCMLDVRPGGPDDPTVVSSD